jgi:hypothetical protein
VSSGANLQNIFNNLRILQQERILHHNPSSSDPQLNYSFCMFK